MYLTHLCHIHNREAREENAIRTPKSVLPRLKKDISFLKAKLTLLHKMFGLDCLAKSLEEDEKNEYKYKGYHTYSSHEEITDLFRSGRPISGFCLDNNYDRIHVAYNRHKDMVSYTTFTFKKKDLIQESCGVQYCRFYPSGEELTVSLSTLKVSAYGMMLPFKKKNDYACQFTIIYSDWEVLICNGGEKFKTQVPVSKSLFSEVINDGVY